MRLAKPILAVTTPLGVAIGLHQAWRINPRLAVLMAVMIGILGALVWYTVRRIRAEQRQEREASK
jgi:hypothetical protein